jgi:hypothetical protein
MSVSQNPHPPALRASPLSRMRERVGVRALPLRRFGATAAAVAAALVALELIGFVATVYFGPELLEAAKSAGVAELLPR